MSKQVEVKFWRVEKSRDACRNPLVFVKVHLVEVKNGWRVARKKELEMFEYRKVLTEEVVKGLGWRRSKTEARLAFVELMKGQRAQKWIELAAFDEYLVMALEMEDWEDWED